MQRQVIASDTFGEWNPTAPSASDDKFRLAGENMRGSEDSTFRIHGCDGPMTIRHHPRKAQKSGNCR